MTDHVNDPQIVNVVNSGWSGVDEDSGRWKRLGREAGSTRLGCTLEEIHPGGRPASYHYHLANEEAMYVIDGDGTLRIPEGKKRIKSGDYIAFPVGKAGAHAVENTSDEVLRCLFFSTMREPDVLVYPDEEKLHVVAGAAPGQPREERTVEATIPFDNNATDTDE